MPLRDYEAFAEEPLVFPYKGKLYEVPPVGIDEGLKLAGVISGKDESLKDKTERELFTLVLGTVEQQLRDDKVPIDVYFRAGMAALADFKDGRAAAEAVWESGLNPEALAAWVAAHQKSPSSADGQQSPSSESASPTPTPASTPATTSPKATPRKRPAKASSGRTRRSPNTGSSSKPTS